MSFIFMPAPCVWSRGCLFRKKGALKKEKGGLKKILQATFFHFGQLWLPWPFGQMDKQGPPNACPPFQ